MIYRVFARNAAGLGRPAGFVPVTVTPTWPIPPTAVRVTSDFFRNTLTWSAVPAGGGVAITGYRIEQAPQVDGPKWLPVTIVTATATPTDSHNRTPDGVTVHYRIIPLSAQGESPSSATTSGTLPHAATLLDVNGMNRFTVTDAQVLYYNRALIEVLGDGSVRLGYARLRQTLLAPHTPATGDATLLAWVTTAHRVAQDHGRSRLDLNGDGGVDAIDALLLYYAHEFRTQLGDGRDATAGSAALRCTLLGGLTAAGCTDETLRMLLREANEFGGN